MGASVSAGPPQSLPLARADSVQIGAAAVKALAAGQGDHAVTLAGELLRRNPKDALGYYIFARAMLAAGDTATARVAARSSFGAELEHSRSFAQGLFGMAQLDRGRNGQGGTPAYDRVGLDLSGAKHLGQRLQLRLTASAEKRD